MSTDEMAERIMDFLRTELRIDTGEIGPDSELVSTGVVDSTDLVRLAAFLERAFDIEIPDQDVSSDHFETVAMSVRYVEGKRAA